MSLSNVTIRPVSLCTFLIVLGEVMSSIALTFSGFALIPCWDTMKLRNFSGETPKTHLLRLSFILYLLKVSNVSWRSSRWVFAFLLFMSMLFIAYLLVEHLVYQSLERGTCILQSKWHDFVTIQGLTSYEYSFLLIFLIHEDLVITWKCIHEG